MFLFIGCLPSLLFACCPVVTSHIVAYSFYTQLISVWNSDIPTIHLQYLLEKKNKVQFPPQKQYLIFLEATMIPSHNTILRLSLPLIGSEFVLIYINTSITRNNYVDEHMININRKYYIGLLVKKIVEVIIIEKKQLTLCTVSFNRQEGIIKCV